MNSIIAAVIAAAMLLIPQCRQAELAPPAVLQPQNYSAEFKLGRNGKPVTLQNGIQIGEWTVENLQLQYSTGVHGEDTVRICEVDFYGNVTIEGVITPSLLADNAYDFCIDKSAEAKLPFYIHPELEYKEDYYVMLALSDDVSTSGLPAMGESAHCRITVTKFQYIFIHAGVPSAFVVESIEIIN